MVNQTSQITEHPLKDILFFTTQAIGAPSEMPAGMKKLICCKFANLLKMCWTMSQNEAGIFLVNEIRVCIAI